MLFGEDCSADVDRTLGPAGVAEVDGASSSISSFSALACSAAPSSQGSSSWLSDLISLERIREASAKFAY